MCIRTVGGDSAWSGIEPRCEGNDNPHCISFLLAVAGNMCVYYVAVAMVGL